MTQDVCIFFLQEVLMTVDAAMEINIFSGLPGMRNIWLAKQPHRPTRPPANPVLPYLSSNQCNQMEYKEFR